MNEDFSSDDDNTPTFDELGDRRRTRPQRRRQHIPPPTPAGAAGLLASVNEERILADRDAPRAFASLFLEEHRMYDDPTIVFWAKRWWIFDADTCRFKHYIEERLRADLWRVLDRVDIEKVDPKTKERHCERLTVRSSLVSNVVDGLRSVAPLLEEDAPQWVRKDHRDPPIGRLVACANGLLDLDTKTLHPRTARLFTTSAISAPWRTERQDCTAWSKFLRDLWGTDAESINTLREIFGYLLTADTSQQKIFALIGPPRSGKGTIARVLTALLGSDAVANPAFSSLEGPHGTANLVGKSLAILGDARVGQKTDQARIVELLLLISGEDRVTINPKNKDQFDMRMRTRLLFAANEVPALHDPTGALPSRFVFLKFTESFLGKEEMGLESKLLAELPGIFQWAVDGWDALQKRGHFVQPESGKELAEEMGALAAPLRSFIADECVLGGIAISVPVARLYERYTEWCKRTGRSPTNRQKFGRDMRSSVSPHKIERLHPSGDDGREPTYYGIGLRSNRQHD